MLLMLIIPIVLTIAPAMLYQIVLLLGKRKSTSTHYTWTYIMMIYIWLVISVTGIGSIWDIISKGGLMATFDSFSIRGYIHILYECNNAYAFGIFTPLYLEKF